MGSDIWVQSNGRTVLALQYPVLRTRYSVMGCTFWVIFGPYIFDAMNLESTPPLLEFRKIRVMRGQKIALDDFSLSIGADEHVAILGPNGCGKSTLIKTITRECYPL